MKTTIKISLAISVMVLAAGACSQVPGTEPATLGGGRDAAIESKKLGDDIHRAIKIGDMKQLLGILDEELVKHPRGFGMNMMRATVLFDRGDYKAADKDAAIYQATLNPDHGEYRFLETAVLRAICDSKLHGGAPQYALIANKKVILESLHLAVSSALSVSCLKAAETIRLAFVAAGGDDFQAKWLASEIERKRREIVDARHGIHP